MKFCTSTAILLAGALPLMAAAAPEPAKLMSGPALQSPAAIGTLLGGLEARRAQQGFDADHRFAVASQHPGVSGTRVLRVNHTYKGLRIFGSQSVIVASAAGALLSESVADRRGRLGVPADAASGVNTGFNFKAAITPRQAIETAIKSVAKRGRHVVPASAELLIYPVIKTERVAAAAGKTDDELNALDVTEVVAGHELAYQVRTRMRVDRLPVFHDTIVSATDGHIIDQWSMLQKAIGVGKSQYNGEVPLSTTQAGKNFKLIDPLRGTGGQFGAMAVTNADNGSEAGRVFVRSGNIWGDGKQYQAGGSTTNANGQTAAVNAMWGLMTTYDLHKHVLGWHALDGQNTATYIAAHVHTAYDNAYYSDTCKCMFIGDGATFTSLGSVDVVGHEMGHGITAATSDLVYAGESGGLNESSSDIAGEVVEAYARAGGSGSAIPSSGNDWVLGKEISRDGIPLRFMYKPSKDRSSADAWSTSLKRLDVHYSSGPNNRMFYFLSQGSQDDREGDYYSKYLVGKPAAMSGIGIEKAYKIWFKAATTKFTSVTNYQVARAKMIEAAQELYGPDSREARAVQRAYAAINVGADVDE